jgi:hypothetical protein
MKRRFKGSEDFFAGLIFIFFGVAAVWVAQDYPMGTTRRMGPAYFPTILGGALAVLGLAISARSLWIHGKPVQFPTFRPLIAILGAVIGFALLLEPLGLVLAVFVLVLISGLGSTPFRVRESVLLYIVLVLMAVTFFVYGLGLQFSLWPI